MENYYTPEESKMIAQEYKELLKISYQTLSEEDKKLIRKAFDIAVDAHKEQRRKSGEHYIFHPIAVAKIVASNIGLDAVSIASALLHDVVEDSTYTHEDMKRLFGETIAKIVQGLTKISALTKETEDFSIQAENVRKMLLTLNDDIRVILIKIADRLHNMQTMDSMPKHKQEKIASETLYIYAPLAHRIGLYNIKTELEDLGLKYTKPQRYVSILNKIEESKEEQNAYIQSFTEIIEKTLIKENIHFYIKGRSKSIFSIYKKMKAKNISYEDVYDKFAIRIVYKSDLENEKFLAWKIYSIVTDRFQPNTARLRDWISSPKSTGYEALHITVMGPGQRWVEVQIRSERMHEIAEKGYAAHFKYKHGEQKEQGLDLFLNRLQEFLENNEGNAVDFVEDFKLNLYSKEIFVYTPQGLLKTLPKNATPLDFAFAIHSEVGLHTRGARVNGNLVPLYAKLNNGDTVEILTHESASPNQSWLEYAITSRALSKIRSALRENKKQIADEGKEMLRRKLRQLKIALSEEVVNDLVTHFKMKTSQDVFYQVATNGINNTMLRDFASKRSNVTSSFFKLFRKKPKPKETENKTASNDVIVFGMNDEKFEYTLAKCCNPIAGDSIFAFVTTKDGVKVHKKNCPNAISLNANYSYRIMPARWQNTEDESYEVSIKLTGLDRKGIVGEITNHINQHFKVTIVDIHFNSTGGVFTGEITLMVSNKLELNSLIDKLSKLDGVDKIFRM